MSDITEYQQVAAIVCMDVDILAKVTDNSEWTAEELKTFIIRLKKNKDLLISDDAHRKMRYNAISQMFATANKNDSKN